MDPFTHVAIHRAKSALDLIAGDAPPPREAIIRKNAEAFVSIAKTFAASDKSANAVAALRGHHDAAVQKAAANSLGDDFWSTSEASALASSFIESIAELSLLDQLARYALRLQVGTRNVMVASDETADLLTEGTVKPVRRLVLSLEEADQRKAVSLIVATRELLNETGSGLFEAEMRKSVLRASNQAVLQTYVHTNTLTVPGTGDALEDLRAGLRAAGPSDGFVVAAGSGAVADLATRLEAGPGFGVRGGEFKPGIHIAAIDDFNGLLVIPASRAAVWLGGLEVRSSGEGAVDMRDDPQSPAQAVSLWQTGSVGLIAERGWHIAQAEGAALVTEPSP